MRALLNSLQKLLAAVHRLEDGLLVAALVGMLILALTQILLRNLFDSGLLWAESFLRVLVLWVAMLGAMAATRERRHISIDLLSRLLPSGWLMPLRLLTLLFSAAVCATAAFYSLEYVSYEYQDGAIAFANVPVWVCQAILPAGFAVMGLRFLAGMFQAHR